MILYTYNLSAHTKYRICVNTTGMRYRSFIEYLVTTRFFGFKIEKWVPVPYIGNVVWRKSILNEFASQYPSIDMWVAHYNKSQTKAPVIVSPVSVLASPPVSSLPSNKIPSLSYLLKLPKLLFPVIAFMLLSFAGNGMFYDNKHKSISSYVLKKSMPVLSDKRISENYFFPKENAIKISLVCREPVLNNIPAKIKFKYGKKLNPFLKYIYGNR